MSTISRQSQTVVLRTVVPQFDSDGRHVVCGLLHTHPQTRVLPQTDARDTAANLYGSTYACTSALPGINWNMGLSVSTNRRLHGIHMGCCLHVEMKLYLTVN